jgi:hypothetical protein
MYASLLRRSSDEEHELVHYQGVEAIVPSRRAPDAPALKLRDPIYLAEAVIALLGRIQIEAQQRYRLK